MDFSHGDPEASSPLIRRTTDSHIRYKPEYTTEIQPLSDSMNDTDAESDFYEGKPTHVSFEHSSTSIETLRQESKTLLEQNRPKTPSSALYKTLLDTNALQGEASIFELCTQDRQRVGRLIKELVESHDRFDELQTRLQQTERRERKYKQKCSDVMKKLDSMDERSRKLENDKEKLKHGYLEKLTALQHQIACISSKLEMSAQDLHSLKEENISLHTEVRSLQTDKSSIEVKYKSVEKECRSTKSLLHAALEREITQQHFHNTRTKRLDPGMTQIFPVQSFPSSTKAEEVAKNSVNMKDVESRFPSSSSSMSSSVEEKDHKSNGPAINAIHRFDGLKGLQDKEAAILQDLFFLF